ncbi:hypothetical protein GCM10009589_00700 [Arthrobacter pascens]
MQWPNGSEAGQGTSDVAAEEFSGEARSRALQVVRGSLVGAVRIVLTQYVRHANRPFYLTKMPGCGTRRAHLADALAAVVGRTNMRGPLKGSFYLSGSSMNDSHHASPLI